MAELAGGLASGGGASSAAVSATLNRKPGKVFRHQYRPDRFTTATDISSAAVAAAKLGGASKLINVTDGVATILPAADLFDLGQGYARSIDAVNASYIYNAQPNPTQERSLRFMTDATNVSIIFRVGSASAGAFVFIDNRPTAAVPYTLFGNTFLNLAFSSATPRLIEVRSNMYFAGAWINASANIWKPAPMRRPRVAVIGDSYALGAGPTFTQQGMYAQLADFLDLEDVWVDGIGSTGFAATAGGANYQSRVAAMVDATNVAPDVLIFHGGGANDFHQGISQGTAQAAAIACFAAARAALPSAKLVFVEPFAPPAFAADAANYPAFIAAMRAALPAYGAYFIDTFTSGPWITGTGTTAAPAGDGGNADFYIVSDATHPNLLGHLYLAKRMAPQLLQVLAA